MTGERDLRLPPHLQSAKIAFGALTDAFGGQVAAAAETGKSQSRLCAYAHPNTADFAPLDVVDALEARTVGTPGHPHVTAWLARRRGYELVRLPDLSAPTMPWTVLVSELVKAAGQLASGILADVSNEGDLRPCDAWRRLNEARELVRVAVEAEARLKSDAEAGGN